MTDIQYAFTHFLRIFVVITFIAVGYGYLLLSTLTTRKLAFILQLLSLVGLSALFSLMVLRSDSMWSRAPEVSLVIFFGIFTVTVVFYMFSLLFRAFERLIAQ